MEQARQRVRRRQRPSRMSSMRPMQTVGCAVATLLFCWADRARAEPSPDDKALATVLFQDGRTLMSEGRIAEACPKLEESQRLDPSGGTLLNLALCHEQEGRLARAWSEFNDALVLARKDSRRDRENAAREHIAALTPRLSKLTVVVPLPAQVNGLRIERDGRELGPGAWSTAMPADGGEHVVRATAPGKQPFATTVVLSNEGDTRTVEIPALADALAAPAAAPSVVSSTTDPAKMVLAPSPAVTADRGPGMRRTLAYVIGGVGLAQLGLAGYFGWRAFDKNDRYMECVMLACESENDPTGVADAATVLTITGVVAAATGIFLFVTSRPKSVSSSTPESKLTLDIWGRGMKVGGRF